ncbi:MAG: hypothetical protein KJ685_00970 [Nanoarchaeota archaeon]|nr:hypothetical protein [Nanoarchaeota archaeon]
MKQTNKQFVDPEKQKAFLKPEENIQKLEETRKEVIRFTNELDEKLRTHQIDGIEYHVLVDEKLNGKHKEEIIKYIDNKIIEEKIKIKQGEHEQRKKKTALTFSAAAIVLVLLVIVGILYTTPDALTGFTTFDREVQESIDYNRVFDHYTETPLNISNVTSLKISGILDGTGATVKLRVGDIEYLIANIINQQEESLITGLVIAEEPEYEINTDKIEYALGETATITIIPEAENKSIYVSYGGETQKLEGDTYLTENIGEHQVVGIIVLTNDIIRLETNFTVINQTINETNTTIPDTTNTTNETISEETTTEIYTFEALCTDTCNLNENSNPVLIVELEEGSTLTITKIIVVQNKENNAPEQTQTIPDITITTTQTATLNLDEYFTDADGDLVAYDLNEIAEITSEFEQEVLTISSETPGIYIAYIYATDGDKLTTSNTFQITITEVVIEETNQTNQTIPEINQTINETNATETNVSEHPAELNETAPAEEIVLTDPCSNPDPNLRPPECIEGKEEKYFVLENVFLKDNNRGNSARITALGNMIIKGDLIDNSILDPERNDFKVTMTNEDYEDVPIAWIDSDNGNLHLTGVLYEEDFFLTPTPNAFVIQNKRNVNLAYFDRNTGDLHIKGNLIQQRETIE